MLGKLPFVLGYGVYCQNGGSEKIFFQFLTSCKKCLDAGKDIFLELLADTGSLRHTQFHPPSNHSTPFKVHSNGLSRL